MFSRDSYGRRIINEDDLISILYHNPNFDFSNIISNESEKYNQSLLLNHSTLEKLKSADNIDISPEEWHQKNQKNWFLPAEYKNFDIAKWVLDQCQENPVELQRCGQELLEFASRDLLPFLCYLKYLVDTMRSADVVWGVGRGSSVASFVLYKIGIHRINSIEYQLPVEEFFKELINREDDNGQNT